MDLNQAMSTFAQNIPGTTAYQSKFLDKMIYWALRLLVLVVPIFFLPWTNEIFEFNKQSLLLVLSVLLFVLWVAKVVFSKGTIVKKSFLNWLVLLWLVAVILSTIFSVDPITSVMGFYGRFNGSLLSTISYVLLYFIVLNEVKTSSNAKSLIGWWLGGVGLAALSVIFQILGLRLFTLAAGQVDSFSLFGLSLNAVVIMFAASLPLALWLSRDAKGLLSRWLGLIIILMSTVALVLVDYMLGWVAAVVALLFWLIMVFIKNESVGFKWTMLPSLILLISVVAWPINLPSVLRTPSPVEVNLSQSASWKIAAQNFKKNLALGTGPETFIFGFSEFKPDDFNKSNFWAFRFDKASSELAQVLSTTGALGFLSYISLILLAIYSSWKMLKNKQSEDWYFKASIVGVLAVMLFANIYYYFNTSLSITFWLILGLISFYSSSKSRDISLTSSPRTSFIFSFGLALVVLIGLTTIYTVGRFWMADVAFAQSRLSAQKLETLDQAALRAQEAVRLNPYRDIYHITFAQILLAQANRINNQAPAPTPEGKNKQIANLQQFITLSINEARKATDLGPENVANWEALGSIYRGTVLFAKDAENWVIDSFNKAIVKEPKNPALYTELGKAYLLSASRKIQERNSQQAAGKNNLQIEIDKQISLALDNFDKAVALKDDYTPAHFNQALSYELQGDFDKAIAKLERMLEFNGQDVDVIYELGSLYYNQAEYNKAENAFLSIISLIPNHANSHLGLALVYEKTGDKVKAIEQLNKVIEVINQSLITSGSEARRANIQAQIDSVNKKISELQNDTENKSDN